MTENTKNFYNKYTLNELIEKFGIISVHFYPFEDMEYVYETEDVDEAYDSLKEYVHSTIYQGYRCFFNSLDNLKKFTKDDELEFCKKVLKDTRQQLTRKTQECEMWKNLTVDNGAVALKYQQQLDQLKKTNEELQKENDDLKDKVKKLTIIGMDLNQSNEHLRKNFFATDKSRDNWREKAEKLKQTIAEIKEIADKDFRHTAWEEYAKQLKQILQKISEAENE